MWVQLHSIPGQLAWYHYQSTPNIAIGLAPGTCYVQVHCGKVATSVCFHKWKPSLPSLACWREDSQFFSSNLQHQDCFTLFLMMPSPYQMKHDKQWHQMMGPVLFSGFRKPLSLLCLWPLQFFSQLLADPFGTFADGGNLGVEVFPFWLTAALSSKVAQCSLVRSSSTTLTSFFLPLQGLKGMDLGHLM